MFDPLNISIPTAGVKTTYPLLPEGDYVFQLAESSIVPSNFDPELPTWNPKLVTTEPATSPDGEVIPPNHQVYMKYNFNLAEEKEPKYPGQWVKSLCMAVDAFLGTDDQTRPDPINKDLLDSLVGKTVLGTVIIDTDKSGISRNKIKRLKKVSA